MNTWHLFRESFISLWQQQSLQSGCILFRLLWKPSVYALLMTFTFHSSSLSQPTISTQRANGPFVGKVRSLVSLNNSVYALVTDAPANIVGTISTSQNGVYRSTNNGTSWTHLPSFPIPESALTLQVHLNSLFVTTSNAGGVLYRSTDEGRSWQAVAQNMLGNVTHLVTMGDTLFARTGTTRLSSMYRSTDTGRTWSLISAPGAILSVVGVRGRQNTTQTRTLLFGGFFPSMNSLLRSIDGGLRWDDNLSVSPNLSDLMLFDIVAKFNDELFLATNKGVLVSTNNGLDWRALNNGIEGRIITDIGINGSILYAASNDGLFINTGIAWETVPVTFSGLSLRNLAIDAMLYEEGRSTMLIGTTKGIYRAAVSPSGLLERWEQCNRGLPGVRIEPISLAFAGTVPLAATQNYGVFRASDGSSWFEANNGLGQIPFATRLISVGQPPLTVISSRTNAFTSTDAGLTWRSVSSGLTNELITAFGTANNSLIFAGTQTGSIFRTSTANPQVWTKIIFNPLESSNTQITGFAQSGNTIFASTIDGLLSSIDAGSTWVRVSENILPRIPLFSIVASGSTLLAGSNNGVYYSHNGGNTWVAPGQNGRIGTVQSVFIRDGLLYAGTPNLGLHRSSDNGSTWTRLAIDGLSAATSLAADSTRLLIGSSNGIVEMQLPSPTEFPIITRLQPADSVFIGIGDANLIIEGRNFTQATQVQCEGRMITVRSARVTEISVTIPADILLQEGTKRLEVINPSGARASTTFRAVPLPPDFPQLLINTSLEPFVAFISQTSAPQTYFLQGSNVRDSIVLQVPESFEISTDGGNTWFSGRIAFRSSSTTVNQSVSVRFRPTNLRVATGEITHSVGGIVLQRLSLTGSPRSLQIVAEPSQSLDFGATKLGQTLRRTVTISNPNSVSITLATVISGVAARDYSLSQRQIIIPPSGRATVEVSYSPTERGEREALLEILGVASTEISLRGRGTQAVFTLSPASITFSTIAFVGQTLRLPRETVRIVNTGDVADEIQNVHVLGSATEFRVIGFDRRELAPNEHITVTIEAKPDSVGLRRASITLVTGDRFSTFNTVQVSAQGEILRPPQLVFPNVGVFITPGTTQLRWLPSPLATHYEVAFDNVFNASRLISRNTQIVRGTGANVNVALNNSYYWTVRSLVIQGQDTLTKSVWQNWLFFTAASEPRIFVPPVLDFGTVTMQQGETPPRSHPVYVTSGTWRVLDVNIVQEPENPNGDYTAFRIVNRDALTLSGALLKPLPETYPIAVAFRPPRPRTTPYTAIAELRVQNTTTNEILAMPFQVIALATICPTQQTGAVQGNVGCPETLLALQLAPQKAVYSPGDDVRLQVQLLNTLNVSPPIDRFFRRLRLTIDVQNISLLYFTERLTLGLGGDAENSVRVIPFTSLETLQANTAVNPNGKIRLVLERPSGLRNGVLGEIRGKAVIGISGLGTRAEQSAESVIMRVSDVQWISDRGDVLDSGQVIVWGNTQGVSLTSQALTATVNTCIVATNGSLFVAKTLPFTLSKTSPNPASEQTLVNFSLQEHSQTEMVLVNVFGQTIKTIFREKMSPGAYSMPVPLHDVPTGTYFLMVKTPSEIAQIKMEVVR
ncbi:MAG: choice-of-anchor D domain-containing protein [Candidatus Kapabacteria bacterium]|nr:choice-of-anchor D domain-containing protein [Candidatus Kapabacteria bacterium]